MNDNIVKLAQPVDIFVGQRIRARRRKLGISQERLAESCEVSFQQVQKYENGANRISCSRLVMIAAALKTPVAWFYEGLEEITKAPAGLTQERLWLESEAGHAFINAAQALPRPFHGPVIELMEKLAHAEGMAAARESA